MRCTRNSPQCYDRAHSPEQCSCVPVKDERADIIRRISAMSPADRERLAKEMADLLLARTRNAK